MTEFKPADINVAPICIFKKTTHQILAKSNTEEEFWP